MIKYVKLWLGYPRRHANCRSRKCANSAVLLLPAGTDSKPGTAMLGSLQTILVRCAALVLAGFLLSVASAAQAHEVVTDRVSTHLDPAPSMAVRATVQSQVADATDAHADDQPLLSWSSGDQHPEQSIDGSCCSTGVTGCSVAICSQLSVFRLRPIETSLWWFAAQKLAAFNEDRLIRPPQPLV